MEGKVETVVSNWLSRFVANDLDYLDVRRTLDDIDDWDDWADAWEATARQYEALADDADATGHDLTAAAHRRRAALTLQFAQFVLTEDVARREQLHRRQCELYRRAAPSLSPPAEAYERRVGEAVVHGYVRRPVGATRPPVVLLIPGLESTKEQFSTYEPYFLERGVATVSMEGPGQGEGWYAHRFDLDTYLEVFADVVAWIRGREDVDGARLGVLGTSFGGFLALRCAAEQPDVSCVVDLSGPHTLLPLEELQPVLQDGFVHLTRSEDVDEAAGRLADVTLDGHLQRISAPVLVVHGDADKIIDVSHGDRIAKELAGRATYDRLVGGGHSGNNLHATVRPRVADWVADHLVVASPEPTVPTPLT